MKMDEHQNPAEQTAEPDQDAVTIPAPDDVPLAEGDNVTPAKGDDVPLAEGGDVLPADGEDVPPAEGDGVTDLKEMKLALEAALLASSEPLQTGDLKKLFDSKMSHDSVRILLEEIRAEWAGRSVELSLVANGWRFRVKPEYQKYVDRLNPEKPPKYSRAVLETLAIIAYRQPVTRGDIEDIRGVMVSPGILKALEERGWIDAIGHKDVPGRPALFATTKKFLDDLNLRSLEELPPLHELQATLDMNAMQGEIPAALEFSNATESNVDQAAVTDQAAAAGQAGQIATDEADQATLAETPNSADAGDIPNTDDNPGAADADAAPETPAPADVDPETDLPGTGEQEAKP